MLTVSFSLLDVRIAKQRQADASTTRTALGLGLGLSIARHLVELHGGSIEATSDGVGRGAAFVVRLPNGARGGHVPPIQMQLSALDRAVTGRG